MSNDHAEMRRLANMTAAIPGLYGFPATILALLDEIEALRKERDELRKYLIAAGNATGAMLSDDVSTDFLSTVADNARAYIARIKAERDELRAKLDAIKAVGVGADTGGLDGPGYPCHYCEEKDEIVDAAIRAAEAKP